MLCTRRPANVFLNHVTCHGRREQSVAAGGSSYRFGELPCPYILQEKATGSGLQGLVYVLAPVEGGEYDYTRRVRKLQQSSRGLESIADRHSNVHQSHIRMETSGQL